MVNSSLSHLYTTSRGLQQGDRLSPSLFTIVAEALGALLVRAMDKELSRSYGFLGESEWGPNLPCLVFFVQFGNKVGCAHVEEHPTIFSGGV